MTRFRCILPKEPCKRRPRMFHNGNGAPRPLLHIADPRAKCTISSASSSAPIFSPAGSRRWNRWAFLPHGCRCCHRLWRGSRGDRVLLSSVARPPQTRRECGAGDCGIVEVSGPVGLNFVIIRTRRQHFGRPQDFRQHTLWRGTSPGIRHEPSSTGHSSATPSAAAYGGRGNQGCRRSVGI